MKKIILFLFLTIFLFSCFSSSSTVTNTTITTTWLTLYENKEFTMSLPSNWDILSSTWNILPKPKNWEISLAASSSELNYGFSNNLLILSQKLDKQVSSLDFSILNNVWSTREYLEYIKLEAKNFNFSDWDKSKLYIFEARYNITTPKLKFMQIWKICNISKAYLLTIALATDIKDTSKYEEILKTFKCK